MWSLNCDFKDTLYQFSQRSEVRQVFSATVCDNEIFASCHCDKCELVSCELAKIAIRLLLINKVSIQFDYQLVLPFDFLTFNKIFAVDYTTINMIGEHSTICLLLITRQSIWLSNIQQYGCCWLRDNTIECWHSTRLLSHIQQHCQTFNVECQTIYPLTYFKYDIYK